MSGRIQTEIIDNETYQIIEIDYNTSFDIKINIKDENNAAKNCSTYTKIYFTAKQNLSDTDANALININSSANSGQFNASSASSGVFVVSLSSANSIVLPFSQKKAYFAIRLDRTVSGAAKTDILTKGKIYVEKTAHLNTS